MDAFNATRLPRNRQHRAANVYAVDVADGKLLWKTKVDNFPIARVTGSPVFHNGRLYVGVASGEETAGAPADY